MKDLNSKTNPIARIFALGEVKRQLDGYDQAKLNQMDVKLLMGFYRRRVEENQQPSRQTMNAKMKQFLGTGQPFDTVNELIPKVQELGYGFSNENDQETGEIQMKAKKLI